MLTRTLSALSLAMLAVPALLLTGCQSEEEKKAEQQRINGEIQRQVQEAEYRINDQVRQEVARQLAAAIEDHQRKLAEARKAAEAARTAGKPGTTTTTNKSTVNKPKPR